MNSLKPVYALIIISLLLFSCVPPDPDGTNTITINYTTNSYVVLYHGVEQYDPNWEYLETRLHIPDAAMNFTFTAISAHDYFITDYFVRQGLGGEIVDVGEVAGLGSVTDKPSSGWFGSTAVQQGHGYVLRYKASWDYNNAPLPYIYCRVYVEDLITNTYGGIIGAQVKYQYPF